MTPQELGAFRLQGQVMADAYTAAHGGPAPAAAAPAVAPVPAPRPGAAAPAAAPGALEGAAVEVVDTWVALEDGGPCRKGDVVARDPAALLAGHMVMSHGRKGDLARSWHLGDDQESQAFRGLRIPSGRFETPSHPV